MLSPYPEDESEREDWVIELGERVEWWQHKLPLLGVGHFRIDYVSVVEAPQGRSTAIAGVDTDQVYDSCRFEFHFELFTQLTPREQDEVIVHEWLHVAFRDLTRAVALVDGQLSNSIQDIWDEAVQGAEETLIDRLARQIVALS